MTERLIQSEDELRRTSVTVERQATLQGEELTLRLNRLPLGQGPYEIDDLGTLVIHLENRAKDGAEQIILDCQECPELQGSRGNSVRRIEVRNGYGAQMVAPDKLLRVDTGYHPVKKLGRMHPTWRDNNSLAGPSGSRKIWLW